MPRMISRRKHSLRAKINVLFVLLMKRLFHVNVQLFLMAQLFELLLLRFIKAHKFGAEAISELSP